MTLTQETKAESDRSGDQYPSLTCAHPRAQATLPVTHAYMHTHRGALSEVVTLVEGPVEDSFPSLHSPPHPTSAFGLTFVLFTFLEAGPHNVVQAALELSPPALAPQSWGYRHGPPRPVWPASDRLRCSCPNMALYVSSLATKP